VRIDKKIIFSEIEQIKPNTILLSCPDGYLTKVQQLASKIEKDYNIQTIISADPTYGCCDIMDDDASRLGADLAFHIGHNSAVKRIGKRTLLIDVYDDIDFTKVIKKSLPYLKKHDRLGLCTISQYLHQLDKSKKMLEDASFKIFIGEGYERLMDGQIMGCRFSPIFNIRNKIDALVFLGQSRFHAISAALSTGRPTIMLDPYLTIVEDITPLAEKWLKRSILQIYKARDAERFGVIIGLREGQNLFKRAVQVRMKLLDYGKEVQMITLREITEDRLSIFTNIDGFIQTACPRISIDGENFSKPILSIPQIETLFRIWDGNDLGDFLEKPLWV
jgi:2-(3-amino-3-carboxypropyl)histidine synthase